MADWMRSLSATDHLPFSTNRAATLARAAALPLKRGFILIDQDDGVTGLCCELGDAGAHGAGADNANGGRSCLHGTKFVLFLHGYSRRVAGLRGLFA